MSIGRVIAGSLLIAAFGGSPVAAGANDQLLAVPYVPQSEELCGGAAAAMVMRYWGAAGVHAEDFSALVDRSAGGISVGTLARAVADRGWLALPFAGTAADVRNHLAEGRPVIALIEDRPNRYHYVVVVAWTGDRIVSHDPAEAPYRVMDGETFERAWAATGRAALLVLPHTEPELPPPPYSAESIGDARALAGVRFGQQRWGDAARLAAQAVARDSADWPAWQLLAASRFLDGDPDGALEAWNRRGEPRVDLARIEGLDRTGHRVIARLLSMPPDTLLTGSVLRRAVRRIAALPSVQMSHVSYSPRENGTASIDVAVLERPLVPATWPSLAAAGLYAATAREARLDIASPTGNGETWTMTGGWSAARPHLSLSLAMPQLGRASGVWRVDGIWERQRYRLSQSSVAGGSSDALHDSDRRRGAVTFSDWATGNLRWEASGALDHWRERGRQFSLGVAVENRLFGDHVAVRADGFVWPKAGKAHAFGSSTLAATWRSSGDDTGSWIGHAAVSAVSARAPLDIWPGTDTGLLRPALLRAHPLLDDGAIRASSLARVLANATIEFQRPMIVRPLARLHWAAFADVAKHGRTLGVRSVPLTLDFGVGLRVRIPGAPGTMRVDLARGARDGRHAMSVAWQPAWPGW